MATPTRNEMIEWLAVHGSKTGNTTASTVRTYYQHQDESVIQNDFTRELTKQQAAYAGARRNLPETPELKVARESAAAAIQARDAAYADMVWSSICAKPVKHVNPRYNGKTCSPSQACRTEVFSWPHDGERMSPEWFQKIMDQQPFLADRLAWTDYLSPSAQKQHNAQVEASTRATFHTLARDYDLSRCESNVQAILQHFPEGADAFQIGLAVQNHELNLAQCNKAQHLEYTQELEKEHERKWKNMPIHEVRKRSAECNAEREALLARHSWQERGTRTKQDEAEARQQAIKAQEELLGYPIMPAALGETTLDAAYLRGCDRDQLTDAIRRFGAYQVNQRLVGK